MEGVNGKVGRRRNVYFSRPHCTEDNKEWLTFTLSQPLHGLFVSYARLNGTRCEFLDSGKYLLFLGWLLLAKQLRTCISAVFVSRLPQVYIQPVPETGESIRQTKEAWRKCTEEHALNIMTHTHCRINKMTLFISFCLARSDILTCTDFKIGCNFMYILSLGLLILIHIPWPWQCILLS